MRIPRSLVVAVAAIASLSAIAGAGWFLWSSGSANQLGEPATVTVGTATSPVPISPDFWGLNVEVTHRFNQSDGAMVSATPVTYLRFPGGNYADRFNYTSSVLWNLNGSSTSVPTTVAAFITTCVAIHCRSILELPGEINSSSTAAYYVTYVEQTLGFHPDFWEIGNEPAGWVHFNVPWTMWATTAGGNTTPMQYAHLAHDYIAAIRTVDPTTPIMAPSAGQEAHYARAWIDSVLQVNGAAIAAISVHSYAAWAGPTNPTLSGFFSNLNSTWSLPNVITHDRQYIAADCPGCGTRLFVDEINAAYGTGTYARYLGTFNDTLFIAAEATQGLNLHADSLEWFSFNSGYLGSWETSSDHPQSQYYLFVDLFVHLENETLPVSLTGPGGLYAAATTNGSQDAILIVNTNTTTTASINLGSLPFSAGSSLAEYRWTNATARPVQSSTSATGNVSLPRLSMVLFSGPSRSGPPEKYAVTFAESGLPSGTLWSVNLSGSTNSSTLGTVGFFEVNGSYPYTIGAPAGWYASPAAGGVSVAGSAQQIEIQFTTGPPPKYAVNFEENGLPSGARWSVNLSGSTNSSTQGTVGFTVSNGSYSFSIGAPPGWQSSPATGGVTVAGTPQQVAIQFTTGPPTTYAIRFVESGLPGMTLWSVDLNGSRNTSTQGTVGFSERNGTYDYRVGSPSGWYATPAAGGVTVMGAGQQVDLAFATTTTTAPTVVSFAALPVEVSLGSSVNFTASVAGGTPPYSYAYSGLPPGCRSADNLSLNCTPGQAGVFTVEFTVTDSAQRAGYSTLQLMVSAPPPGHPTPPATSPWAWVSSPVGSLVLGAVGLVAALGIGAGVRARRRQREADRNG